MCGSAHCAHCAHCAGQCAAVRSSSYYYLCIIIYLLFSSAAHCRILPHTAAHCCTLRYVIYCYLFPRPRAVRVGSRGAAGTQQEEPSQMEGSGQPQNCDPPPGQKYAEASIILFDLILLYCHLFIIFHSIFIAAHCRTLTHTAAHCCMLFIVICVLLFIYYSVVPHTATFCRTLPHTTAHFRMLFIVICLLFFIRYSLPHTAAHCYTLLYVIYCYL